MIPRLAPAILAALLCSAGWDATAQQTSSSPPLTYELMINGESFYVEADRQEHLESRQSPGQTYDVALRVAMTQPVRLNTIRFDYSWPAQVTDDRGKEQRTVRIRHELGYTMLITDLGPPPPPENETAVLDILVKSVAEGLRESEVKQIQVGDPHTLPFSSAKGRGVVIRYRDSQDSEMVSLVYLLINKEFAASVVTQYAERDADGVLPGVRKTINSIRPIDQQQEQQKQEKEAKQ